MSVIRPSITLQQADEVSRRRAAGETIYSLSSPTFDERGPELAGLSWTTRLGPAAGNPELSALARRTLFARWQLPSHECWISAGSKAAIYSILRRLAIGDGAVVIVSPSWPSYDELARLCFLKPVHFNTHLDYDFDLDPDRFRAFLADRAPDAVAVVLSNPANPTGKIYDPGRLEWLLALASERRFAVILDESFSGSVRDWSTWRRPPEVAGAADALYVVNSFSKNYHLQGLRVAACLCPKSALSELVNIHQAVNSAASGLAQTAALGLAARKDEGEIYRSLEPQWELTRSFMSAQGWRCMPPQGSFHCFPKLNDVEAFARRASAGNVAYLPGEAFGAPYAGFVRLCFAKPLAELEAIFDRLSS